jgi:hypothetical protein
MAVRYTMKTQETPQDEAPKGGLWTVILAIIKLISDFFKRKDTQQQSQAAALHDQEVAAAQDELKKALAEGRITDAAFWRKKLQQLTATAVLLMLLVGCNTTNPPPTPVTPQFIVIGERINKVKPGDNITVPPLVAPAKQWYLVDDTGLYQWLSIDLAVPTSKSFTYTNLPCITQP